MVDIEERCDILPAWPEAMSVEDWHNQRATGLGGSDLGSICGVNKYTSELQIWAEKTSQIPREEIDNEAIFWGKELERPVAGGFAKKENVAVVEWPVSLRLKSHPWMLANLDFLIVEPSEQFPAAVVTTWKTTTPPEGIIAILEIKTTGLAGFGTAHQWGDDDDEKMPASYELQCRHYSIVAGIHDVYLVGLLGGRGLTIRRVEWDEVLAENLIDIESDFWNNHVLTGIAPDPDGSESAEDTLKALFPRSIEETEAEGGAKLDLLWNDYVRVKDDAKVADDLRKELRSKIIALIGNAAYATVYGKRIASFKSSQDSEYFDEKAFAKEEPEAYKTYLKTRPGHRTLRKVT